MEDRSKTGLKVKLPGLCTDLTRPIYYQDNRMNAGSLLLVDFSHPYSDLGGVIPANGSTVPNIAWSTAKALISSGTENTLKPTIVNTIESGKGLMEYTSKKGLHGIISQVNDVNSGNDFFIHVPQLIREYIHANIARGFYVSLWTRKTRATTTGTSANAYILTANTSSYCTYFGHSSQSPGSGTGFIGRRNPSSGTSLNNEIRNIAVSGFTGSPSNATDSAFKFGSGGAFGFFELNKADSIILYQMHIVDITASGKTYAQLDAEDLAAFNAAFGVGGRFNGDTFTSPSTLP